MTSGTTDLIPSLKLGRSRTVGGDVHSDGPGCLVIMFTSHHVNHIITK